MSTAPRISSTTTVTMTRMRSTITTTPTILTTAIESSIPLSGATALPAPSTTVPELREVNPNTSVISELTFEPPDFGHPRLDRVGKTYIVLIVLWSSVVAVGLCVFLRHRELPFIKFRKVWLVCVALGLLHLQLVFDMLMYPLNGVLPCSLEYWIMNLCLPLGIAAFQVNNWVLFSRAWGQRHLLYLHSSNPYGKDEAAGLEGKQNAIMRYWYRWCRICILRKMFWIAGVCTIIQFLIGLIIYLISRRFHESFGLVGSKASRFDCRAGWEWVPSGLWQAVWTYGFGPFILFKIRNIRDTHHWRLQTTLAILFSLPALPLWLSTFWNLEFYAMNEYWPPNLWFVPGLVAMQFIILCFPLMEIYSFSKLQHKARVEPRNTKFSKYSMAALEQALHNDIDRLEQFAATKDLTGENILFLKRVEAWKRKWEIMVNHDAPPGMEHTLKKELYAEAAGIWWKLISRPTATFPLNIEDDIYRGLERVFGVPDTPYTNTNLRAQIVPFADDVMEKSAAESESLPIDPPEYRPPIAPPGVGFDGLVFDRADAAVRQMVLENTWIRYVDQMPEYERSKIGVHNTISQPLNERCSWKSYLWRKNNQPAGSNNNNRPTIGGLEC